MKEETKEQGTQDFFSSCLPVLPGFLNFRGQARRELEKGSFTAFHGSVDPVGFLVLNILSDRTSS